MWKSNVMDKCYLYSNEIFSRPILLALIPNRSSVCHQNSCLVRNLKGGEVECQFFSDSLSMTFNKIALFWSIDFYLGRKIKRFLC